MRRFVDLPYRLHRGRPGFVPPLRMSELEKLDRDKNPFFRHARMESFLAWRNGAPSGRVAVIDDQLHREEHGENLAFFGFFEAEDHATAAALYEAAEAQARAWGREALRGPINLSMNDSAGFQIDAFEKPPFVMMPWNPPSYPEWAEQAGYRKAKDLNAWLAVDDAVDPRVARMADRVRKRYHPRVREIDLRRFDEEAAIIHRLYSEAWASNWGQIAYTDAEFDHLAKELRMIADARIALFLEVEGEPVGLCLGIPDLNQVLARFDGRLLPFGIVHLLRRRAIIDQMRLAILGVLPEHRHRGYELVLIDEVVRRGMAAGYRRSELSWILEDNEGIQKALRALGASIYKRYRILQKPL